MKANNNDQKTRNIFPSKTNNIPDLKNGREPVKKVENDTEKEDEIYPEVIKPTKKVTEQQKKPTHEAPDVNESEPK